MDFQRNGFFLEKTRKDLGRGGVRCFPPPDPTKLSDEAVIRWMSVICNEVRSNGRQAIAIRRSSNRFLAAGSFRPHGQPAPTAQDCLKRGNGANWRTTRQLSGECRLRT